jgi:hypothetical protein
LALLVGSGLTFVDGAIDFNDEAFLSTKEIHNKRPYWTLASELPAFQLSISKFLPQQFLTLGRLFAEGACNLTHSLA